MFIVHPLLFLAPRRHLIIQPLAEGLRLNIVAPQKILIKTPMYDIHIPTFFCLNHSWKQYNKKTDGYSTLTQFMICDMN